MENSKKEKRLISPNKLIFPISSSENGILDEYILTNDKNCLEIFTCSNCSCLAWDPVCCPKCDKPFCRACTIKNGKIKVCPFGCENESYREITRNEKNFINKIKLKCTNVGCSKYIAYSDYITHLEKCNLRKFHCKNQSCKEEGYINDMINHTKKCPYRLVECTKCKQYIKFCDIKTHQQDQCPEITVKCKLCGTSMKRGVYLREHKSDNNENVKCLKLQVEKWAKTYNDDMNNKIQEVNDLKNILTEMDKKKLENEIEINNLKKTLDEIKVFYKNGFSKFFSDENIDQKNVISPFDISHEISKKFEPEKRNKDYLKTTVTNFYNNHPKKKYNYIYGTELKKGLNNQRFKKLSMSKEDIKDKSHHENNQSSHNLPYSANQCKCSFK